MSTHSPCFSGEVISGYMLKIGCGARWVPSGPPFILQRVGHISLLCTASVEKQAFLWKGKNPQGQASKTDSHTVFNFALKSDLPESGQLQDPALAHSSEGTVPKLVTHWTGMFGYVASRANAAALGLQGPHMSQMQSTWHPQTTPLNSWHPQSKPLGTNLCQGRRGVLPFE